MPNVSPEGNAAVPVGSENSWVLCPAKFNALLDAVVAYGGDEYTRRPRLLAAVKQEQSTDLDCVCPGPKTKILGGQACRGAQV